MSVLKEKKQRNRRAQRTALATGHKELQLLEALSFLLQATGLNEK
jgi:hypothetical protein